MKINSRITSKIMKVINKFKERLNSDLFLYFDLIFCRYFKRIFYFFYKNIPIERSKDSFLRAKEIHEYIINNKFNIKRHIKPLDYNSRIVLITFLKRIEYVFRHNYMIKGELISFSEFKNRYGIYKSKILAKKRFHLPNFKYDTSIFYSHYGLKFLPNNVIEQLMNKDFIDGGAFVGDSALIFENFYKPKLIYAIEPDIKNYRFMLKTIKANNLKKIDPINVALGEKKGILKLSPCSSMSKISKEGIIEVDAITIDGLVSNYNLTVGLIKLDVEGYAKKVLKGAINTIKNQSPILLIGVYHNGEELFEVLDYIKYINEKYNFIIKKIDPFAIIHEITLIAWCSD